MVVINIKIDYPPAASLDEEQIRRAADAALQSAKAGLNTELTIILTDNQKLHELNRDFRKIDHPTDVLAFPDGSTNPENGLIYLGDILIAIPVAAAQAVAEGHSLENEVQLLGIHGTLHLLGYGHDKEQDREKMWELQRRALKKLDIQIRSENWK